MVESPRSFIDWKKSYETGIKQIDNEHKYLCSIINILYDAVITEDSDSDEAFSKALKEIIYYIQCHFKNEEAIMAKVNYPFIEKHKYMHKVLASTVVESAEKYYSGQPFVVHSFIRLLRDWLLEHIALEDIKMTKIVIATLQAKKKQAQIIQHDT